MNVPDLTPAERHEFHELLETGAARITRRRRLRGQLIAGASAVALVVAIAAGAIVAASGLAYRPPIAVSPSVTPTPTPAASTPTPTPPVTPTPPATSEPPAATEPPATEPPESSTALSEDELISLCIEFAGRAGEPIRRQLASADVRSDEARSVLRPDGVWFILVPFSTAQVEAAELGCMITQDRRSEAAWVRIPPETDDFDQWATGVLPNREP
ncbi:hypothetical protein [Microbacterium sp. PA5]|uniref:hypothetical protein n=1 Tax=Microbacterium sp. PA5 TaxID=3416654 RepID=UPI003CE94998